MALRSWQRLILYLLGWLFTDTPECESDLSNEAGAKGGRAWGFTRPALPSSMLSSYSFSSLCSLLFPVSVQFTSSCMLACEHIRGGTIPAGGR